MPRWPNIETIARVLKVTCTSFTTFAMFVNEMAKGYVVPPEERPVLHQRKRRLAA